MSMHVWQDRAVSVTDEGRVKCNSQANQLRRSSKWRTLSVYGLFSSFNNTSIYRACLTCALKTIEIHFTLRLRQRPCTWKKTVSIAERVNTLALLVDLLCRPNWVYGIIIQSGNMHCRICASYRFSNVVHGILHFQLCISCILHR